MRYLLDTNTCIAYLNGRAVGVRHRLQGLPPSDIALCSVVKAELLYGARKSTNPPTVLAKLQHFFAPFTSVPFDDAAAQAYGTIRADLERAGRPIGPNDLMIAATALACGLTLVTHNTGEFQRVAGLQSKIGKQRPEGPASVAASSWAEPLARCSGADG